MAAGADSGISELEGPVRKIVGFVSKLPPRYRKKAFEKLLENEIARMNGRHGPGGAGRGREDCGLEVSVEVGAFLAQFDIPEKSIRRHFAIAGPGEIAPRYKIRTRRRSRAQFQLSCLLALENALRNGRFEFSLAAAKERCREHGCYDHDSFSANFKPGAGAFRSLGDGGRVSLSPLGKERLADILDELSDGARRPVRAG